MTVNLAPFSENYLNALLDADKAGARDIIISELESGRPLTDIYGGIEHAMYEIGRRWQKNEISVTQEHIATAITQTVLVQCSPYIRPERKLGKQVASFTIEKESHSLGISMVNDLFEHHGFDVSFLGPNLPVSEGYKYLVRNRPAIVAVSVSLLYHVSYVNDLTTLIAGDDRLSDTKVFLGGHVFKQHPSLLKQLQYDHYCATLTELDECLKKFHA